MLVTLIYINTLIYGYIIRVMNYRYILLLLFFLYS